MDENILTPDQVAQKLQVHPFTVLKFIKQGKLKASKLGRVYRIRESDVMKFLDEQTSKAHQTKDTSPASPHLGGEAKEGASKKPSHSSASGEQEKQSQPKPLPQLDDDLLEFDHYILD